MSRYKQSGTHAGIIAYNPVLLYLYSDIKNTNNYPFRQLQYHSQNKETKTTIGHGILYKPYEKITNLQETCDEPMVPIETSKKSLRVQLSKEGYCIEIL